MGSAAGCGSVGVQNAQLPVYIKGLIRLDLHLAYALAGGHALVDGRLEVVAPRAPPAVAIAIVVATKEIPLGLRALVDREGYVDGFEQVLFQRWVQFDDVVDVLLDMLGVQPPEQVAARGN